MDELQKKFDERDGSSVSNDILSTPFVSSIMEEPLPKDFRFPTVKVYSGTTDPRSHLTRYRAAMMITEAHDWFGSLPGGSISTFKDLTKQFLSHFATSIPRKKQIADLCDLKQKSSESLAEYLNKWKKEVMGVANFDGKSAIPIFRNNVRSDAFHQDLIQYPPKNYADLMDMAARYADAEAAEKRKREQEEGRGRKDKAPQEERGRASRQHRRDYAEGPRLNPTRFLTPLTHPVSVILAHAEDQGIVEFPKEECMKISAKGDPKKYCRFHRQKGHDTDECILLKTQIEELIQMGYQGHFIKRPSQPQGQGRDNVWKKGSGGSAPPNPAPRKREHGQSSEEDDKTTEDSQPPKKLSIYVIFGGPEGGDTQAERKKWARSLYVGEVTQAPREKKLQRESITFTDDDLPDGPLPHRDALVIKLDVNNVVVHRVLVDTGSSVNVMYYDTFVQLGLPRDQLEQVRTPLSGFTGDSIETEGSISLDVEIGTSPHLKKWRVEFVVVKFSCAHNMILGRPALEDLKCVISMEHLCLKFPTPNGVGAARGDQRVSRSCYLRACRQMGKKDLRVHIIAEKALRDETGRPRAEPIVESEEVVLDLNRPDRVVKVGVGLPDELRARIIDTIRSYKEIFAWGPEDMPGLSREVITHKLAVDLSVKPVQQRKRYLSTDRREFVKKEVDTLLEIGHIREVIYPTWLANVVLAPKPPTWRMCVDYTDLNKACPMDPFPLPNID
ncbi:PREDICTED: uncharacterized protein LOC109184447 [Ipomoea nil]|uniref:uncharacterized protein LOC109184447 n=1 Tax=Ipomoea nil TaxID=35883 RepID=UPI000901BF59|nr:PREDICTED: uncharacterized protein LOC109184447 [Ipomoea nil]